MKRSTHHSQLNRANWVWIRALVWSLALWMPISPGPAPVVLEQPAEAASEGPTSITWRLTNQGWKDIGPLLPRTQSSLGPWTRVHPLTWSAGLILAVSAVLVWSASEWELDRLWTPSAERSAQPPRTGAS